MSVYQSSLLHFLFTYRDLKVPKDKQEAEEKWASEETL